MVKSKVTTVIGFALDILQMIFALVVVALTSWKLLDIEVEGVRFASSCYLDGSGKTGAFTGTQFCVYAIAVGIVSFVANAIFGCIKHICKCVTMNACAASNIVGIIGDTVLGVWWVIAFALFVQRGTAANGLLFPERGARNAVIASSFGAFAAFFADVFVTVCSMVRN